MKKILMIFTTLLAFANEMFGYSEYGEYGKEFVVGWGTLAFLNAAIAQLQGRDSGALWFFLSLFMGPFATFLLWITYEKNGVA